MINIRFLINILLVIVILHLIITHLNNEREERLPYKKQFEPNDVKATYSVEELNEYLEDMDKPGQENFQSRAEMVNEIATEVNMPEQSPLVPVESPEFPEPSNYYTTDANTPNFTSNVMNVKKFYEQNPPNTAVENSNQLNDVATMQTCDTPNSTINQNPDFLKPDAWLYKNEMPMNGGQFGSITGFDNLESAYSLFNTGNETQASYNQQNSVGAKQPDDIRMGLSPKIERNLE